MKRDNTIVTIGDINYIWGIFLLLASARRSGMDEPFLVGVKKFTPEAERVEILAKFKAYYREHINDTTRPYAGVPELLKALREAGVYVGINSNKFDAALQSLCRIHFDGLYDYAVGESERTPKKPDPTAAKRIMAAAGATKAETIYIGDSDVDIQTGKNAGVDQAWVSWGFRRRDEMGGVEIPLAFDSVDALRAFLLGE